MRRQTFILLATAILVGAAFLRIADLHRYPPGLHYDEAADMLLSRDIAFYGYRPFPVVTAYSGREVLFYYVAAPLLRVFGTNVLATRLTSAFLGILTVAATMALGKPLTRSRSLALLAGAWLAVSGPEVWLTRQGFRTSPQPLLEALGLWLLWIALRRVRRWTIPAILGGVFSGLALYVYMAARVFPVWLLVLLTLLVLVDRQRRGQRVRQVLVFLVALGITAAPIVAFYGTHLDIFMERLSQVGPTGQTPTLLHSLGLHLEMFFIRGDPTLRYNLDVGRPFFDPLSGFLLLVGLGVAAYGLFRSASPLAKTSSAFLLLCPLLIAPSVIAVQGLPPSHMRSVAMVPLIFFLPASGAAFLARRLPVRRHIAYLVGVVLLIALGAITWLDYQTWGARADLFYDSDGDLNLAAAWLEQTAPPDSLIYIGSKYYEHPTVLAHPVDPSRIRWMMSDHLFLPPPDRTAVYVFPRSVDATAWRDLLQAGMVADVPAGPDGGPAFLAFRFAPGQLPRPTPQVALDASVRGILRLRGADLPPALSGQRTRVKLYWEVLASPGRDDLAPVVSLVDAWNNEIARVNPYFEYSGQWRPGEWLIQDIPLDIPAGNPPGDYTIKVAWVGTAKPNDYLPLLDDQGRFAGVWAEVKPLKVLADTSARLTAPESAVEVLPGIHVLGATPLPAQIGQGEHLRFTVNWLASQPTDSDSPLRLVAERMDNGKLAVLWSGQPVHGSYPMRQWKPVQQVLDRYDVPIPADFAPGDYRMSLEIDGGLRPLPLGTVRVVAVTRTFTAPTLAHAVNLHFGEAITLASYEVKQSGDQQVTVTLAWQARATPDRDYTVFVHLTDPGGTMFSQQDRPPSRPTSQWIPGEVITDTYTLPTPPGEYTITVGLYVQDNGFRLPVNQADGTALGDEARLEIH
jgi:4-amino-4-deoxy-L-arabinose transferase-like glycosyltransferase